MIKTKKGIAARITGVERKVKKLDDLTHDMNLLVQALSESHNRLLGMNHARNFNAAIGLENNVARLERELDRMTHRLFKGEGRK